MSEFNIGDIAVYCNLRDYPEKNGIDVEIIGGLQIREGFTPNGESFLTTCYEVCEPDGFIVFALPGCLKKKPCDDGNQPAEWDECIFKPTGLNHGA